MTRRIFQVVNSRDRRNGGGGVHGESGGMVSDTLWTNTRRIPKSVYSRGSACNNRASQRHPTNRRRCPHFLGDSCYALQYKTATSPPAARPAFWHPTFHAALSLRTSAKGEKKKPTVETVDWHIEAKAESLMADPTKLYLETTTLWQKPAQWDDKTTQTHLNRLQEVSDFLQTNLIPCLTTDLKNGGN